MKVLLLAIALLAGGELMAQHEQHGTPKEQSKPAVKKATQPKKSPAPAAKKPAKKTTTSKKTSAAKPSTSVLDTSHSNKSMPADSAAKTTLMEAEMHAEHMQDSTRASHRHHDTTKPMDHSMHRDTTHNMHQVQPTDASHSGHDSPSQHEGHTGGMEGMTHMFSRSLPMNRNASGTAWNPDNTPMYMLMKHGARSMWMFHGSLFLRYNNQKLNGSARGDTKIDAPNWFMAMYSRPVGKNGLFGFSSMISLDPLTVGASGYPLLFQSGETYNGKLLVDRQHPHDLFSELAISYTHRLSSNVDMFAYFGYPGEPALSAPAFMHRISALNDPDAPLGHHWQDATHITFGVGTFGLRVGMFKIEASTFTGREPDEDRYGFDEPKFDSYSYRLSFNPSPAWALQFSQGWITSPEVLDPDKDVNRTTASAIYASPVQNNRYFSATAIWGLNDAGHGHKEHSLLAEGSFQFSKQAVYSRYEYIQKSSEELDLAHLAGHEEIFNIHKLSIGANRSLMSFGKIDLLLGGHISINRPSGHLVELYGKTPLAGEVYLQLRPVLFR